MANRRRKLGCPRCEREKEGEDESCNGGSYKGGGIGKFRPHDRAYPSKWRFFLKGGGCHKEIEYSRVLLIPGGDDIESCGIFFGRLKYGCISGCLYPAWLRPLSQRERVSFSKRGCLHRQERARGRGGVERAACAGISEHSGDAHRRRSGGWF